MAVPEEKSHRSGTVEFAEYLEADTILYVACDAIGTITVRATGSESASQGDRVWLRFNENALYFFNEGGMRLR